MSKVKYRYNNKSLTYEKVETGFRDRLFAVLSFLATGLVIGSIFFFLAYTYIDSPKEKELKRENNHLLTQYKILNERMNQISLVMDDIQERDDNIYRTIFEAEPIGDEIRKAGFGGVNRYRNMEGFQYSEVVIETAKRLDQISKQLYIQSKSFDEVMEIAKKKGEMLASIPAIQPVSNRRLKRMASGFGYRIDPHYKTEAFHAGMDFSAPTGTPIYATGDGVVIRADNTATGYGNHVRIDHGYGYVTLYAHMSRMNTRVGNKVKRGDVIGYVGNTGKSMGPHLHYEVRKNDQPVNPVNFYFNDLTPEEYEEMIKLSSTTNQSLD